MLGGLGGDFCKDTYDARNAGKVFCVGGMREMREMRPYNVNFTYLTDGERVRTQGQRGRFFDVWRPWRGLL